jgi:hydrogenase-1 operon protein HyaE
MSLHPLVHRLIGTHGAMPISTATLEPWLQSGGDQVLFFSGDPVRFPEGLDVAVVLPELARAFGQRFALGVVQREDEDAIARRFGAQHWPSLVFLRDGRYVATVAGMKDWDVYLQDVAHALDTPASRPPTIGIPVVGAAAGAACH